MVDYYRQFEASLLNGSKKHNIEFRPCAKSGFWCVALIPAAFLLSLTKFPTCPPSYFLAAFLAVGSAATIRGQAKIWSQASDSSANDGRLNLSLLHQYLAPSAVVTVLTSRILKWSLTTSLYLGLFSSVMTGLLFPYFLRKCPKSFTCGEAAIITQLVVTSFIGCSTSLYLHDSTDPVTIFHQCLLLSGFAYVFALSVLPPLRKPLGFCCWLLIFVGSFITFSTYALQTSPVLWLVVFISESGTRVTLITFWLFCSIVAVVFVFWNHKQQISASSKNDKELTRTRKLFHLLILLVYIPGLAYDIQLLYLASGVALAAFVLIEALRVCKVPPFQTLLNEYLRVFLDEKDQGSLILTPVYLLVGCSLPCWISPTFRTGSLLFAWAGVISLGIGDSAASLCGSLWGNHKWPNSQKSIEGTLCSVASQLIAIFVFYALGMVPMEDLDVLHIVLAVIINALAESLTTQVDNLVIPLCFYLCLT